jgi:hypothetical protein
MMNYLSGSKAPEVGKRGWEKVELYWETVTAGDRARIM